MRLTVIDDPNYDPTTLFVSHAEWEKLKKKKRKGQYEYWKHKVKNFDCILFYKSGSFYETYDIDAGLEIE